MDVSTNPDKVEGFGLGDNGLWQSMDEQWSFGPTASRTIGVAALQTAIQDRPVGNDISGEMTEPSKVSTPPPPARVKRRNFGKRALSSISHWEGVVEAVEGDSFYARLVPFSGGEPLPHRPEFSRFELDELASDEDRRQLSEGVVFYWTLGRMKNAAGSVMNVSLLRLRRLPAVTQHQVKRASDEAEYLLHALGESE